MSPAPASYLETWMGGADRLTEAGVEDARFEAEVLLRHASHRSRAELYANLTDTVDPQASLDFEAYIARRARREPLAYIVGSREFYGLDFQVTPAVLIPRPESELIVETALDHLKRHRLRDALVVDVGTGSGALGIAIAKNRRSARVVGVDVSREALAVARANAQRLMPRLPARWVQADLLTACRGPLQCVVANLPYIPEERLERLQPEVAEHEPRQALVTRDRTGTDINLRLITQLGSRLAPGGVAVIEIDPGQEDELVDAARRTVPMADVTVLNDLSEQPRALKIVPA